MIVTIIPVAINVMTDFNLVTTVNTFITINNSREIYDHKFNYFFANDHFQASTKVNSRALRQA